MPCARTRISMVTACSSSSSMRLHIPGAATQPCHHACAAVACQRLETIGLPQCGHFGTFHLHGRLHPVPLRLACFRAYASSTPLPEHLQGSIPDPWLAVIWAGFPPAGFHGIAMPQPRPDPQVSRTAALRRTTARARSGVRCASRALHAAAPNTPSAAYAGRHQPAKTNAVCTRGGTAFDTKLPTTGVSNLLTRSEAAVTFSWSRAIFETLRRLLKRSKFIYTDSDAQP